MDQAATVPVDSLIPDALLRLAHLSRNDAYGLAKGFSLTLVRSRCLPDQ